MIDQPPFPLVPKETLPIDSADIYEDERGGYAFGRGNFRATYSSQAVNIPACAAKVVNGVPDIRTTRYLPLDAPVYLLHCVNNLRPQKPAIRRPIWSCDSRSKIDLASLELYPPCQVSCILRRAELSGGEESND